MGVRLEGRDLTDAFQALFSDIPENSLEHDRPLLAHYTSIDALNKILTSNEIWLANPLFMNDHEELRWGIENGIEEFRINKTLQNYLQETSSAAEFEFQLNWIYKQFDKEAFDIYLFCLSRHEREEVDGRLSMWRGYGASGDGVAIVFDTSRADERDDLPLILAPVHYASHDERRKWINNLAEQFTDILRDQKVAGRHEYIQAVYWLFQRLKMFALFTKHSGFAEEKEWRLVYFPDRDERKDLHQLRHFITNGRGVEPKLRVPLGKETTVVGIALDDIIHSIILGPSHSTALAERSVKRMLELIGKEHLVEKTRASAIPFRRSI